MLQDFRLALRQPYKYPGFSLAVVLTLTLGIGVNTAVFSMVNGFLLRTLPYPQPERIAALVVHQEGVRPGSGKAVLQLVAIAERKRQGSYFRLLGGNNGVNLKAEVPQAEPCGMCMAATFQRITLSGFDPHHILTAKASLDDARYQEAAAFQNLLAKGVTAMQRALAKADSNLPMSGFYSMEQILAEQLQKQRVEVLLLATLAGSAFVSLWGPRFSKQCCT